MLAHWLEVTGVEGDRILLDGMSLAGMLRIARKVAADGAAVLSERRAALGLLGRVAAGAREVHLKPLDLIGRGNHFTRG